MNTENPIYNEGKARVLEACNYLKMEPHVKRAISENPNSQAFWIFLNFGYKIQGLENHFGKSSFQAKINLILSSSNQKFLSDKGQRYLIGKQYLPGAFVDPQLVKIGAVLELAQSLDESMNTNRKLTKPQ